MLVLSRFRGQRIVIGDGKDRIVLEVLDCREGKVKLGFTADPSVKIHREELLPLKEDTRHGPPT